MATVCRLCMDESDALVDIFEDQSSTVEEPSLLMMLMECLTCKLDQNDELPKKICLSCVNACKNAFRFKRISEQSYQLFIEQLAEDKSSWESNQQQQSDLCIVKVEEIDSFEVPDDEPPDDDDDFLLPVKDTSSLAIKTVESINRTTITQTGGKTIPLITNAKRSGKIYRCWDCGEGFVDVGKLNQHHKMHHDLLKKFRCRHCEEKFAKRSHLNAHIRALHIVNPFKCPHCPKSFARKMHCDEHLSLHSGVWPYKCDDCHKEFRSNGGFKKHICLPAHDELRNAHLSLRHLFK